ncbi:hypothetical protein [uncultured Tenacibaculum sp.]|uniref:hypothetical protein n=1 Tax=uncultured Tenacibaculum sp. TaxID=174713 RepID=UPI00261DBF53|nr:hypothetical protein [uncultured Tenacibaculum sp.]
MLKLLRFVPIVFLFLIGCNNVKVKEGQEKTVKGIYLSLKDISKSQLDIHDPSHALFRTSIKSAIKNLNEKDLSSLFDMFLAKNKQGTVPFVVCDEIVNKLGQKKTKEAANQLIKIYFKHRVFFDGEMALNLRCAFKNLGTVGLNALEKEEKAQKDRFLEDIKKMIINNEACI